MRLCRVAQQELEGESPSYELGVRLGQRGQRGGAGRVDALAGPAQVERPGQAVCKHGRAAAGVLVAGDVVRVAEPELVRLRVR